MSVSHWHGFRTIQKVFIDFTYEVLLHSHPQALDSGILELYVPHSISVFFRVFST